MDTEHDASGQILNNADKYSLISKIESVEGQLFSLVDILSRILDPSNLKDGSSSILFSEYQSTLDNIISQLGPEFQFGVPRVDIPPADPFHLLEKQKEIESENIHQ